MKFLGLLFMATGCGWFIAGLQFPHEPAPFQSQPRHLLMGVGFFCFAVGTLFWGAA